jgi:CRP-like cAMP-binding protein
VIPSAREPQGGSLAPSYRFDLLNAFSKPVAQALWQVGVRRRHAEGATLAQRGQSLASVMVLLRGRMRTMTSTPDGHEHLIRWIEPGEAVGVASVLTRLPFQADLVASGDCEILSIPGDRFLELLQSDPGAALEVARLLARRLSELFDHVAGQSQSRLQDRVRAALRHLASENGERLADGRLRMRVSQQDIANVVGASRQRVNAALHGLVVEGLVELGYRQIILARDESRALRPGKPPRNLR